MNTLTSPLEKTGNAVGILLFAFLVFVIALMILNLGTDHSKECEQANAAQIPAQVSHCWGDIKQ